VGRARACLAAALLAAAAARAENFGREDIILDPDWQRFSVCHDNGCASLSVVGLTEAEWNSVLALLESAPASAAEERERLGQAIALMEQHVGEMTGTWRDKAGSFNFTTPGQMDCHDEAINTTLYLTLFRRYGLLRHHEIAPTATRVGWIINGLPHTTAVIREIATGERWAVDSWFLDNGLPPYILPLGVWRRGWTPGD
jgi:hypothetical protein